MTKKTSAIDPTSDAIALKYIGDGRALTDVPARDLTHNDVARLAYQRDLAVVARDVGQPIDRDDPDSALYERPSHREPNPETVTAVVADLVASGKFTTKLELEPAKAPQDPPTTTTPDATAPSTEA